MDETQLRALEGKDRLADCYHFAECVRDDETAKAELRAADVDPDKLERSVLLTISDEGQDSHKSKIMPRGVDLKRHKSNPIVLFSHRADELPIGRALATYVDTTKSITRLRSVAEFVPGDMNPMGEAVFQMLQNRWIKGVSIGFRTLKAEADPEDPNGYIVSRSELLEYSILSLPSNPRALQEARAHGVNTDPFLEEAKRTLDEEAVMSIVRNRAEAIWLALEGPRIRSRPAVVPVTPAVITPEDFKSQVISNVRAMLAQKDK